MMPIAQYTEKKVAEIRARVAELDPESRCVDRKLAACPPELHELLEMRAELAAYDSRPPCALTPMALDLINQATGRYLVHVDCGWILHHRAYQIEARMVMDGNEYRVQRLLAGVELRKAYFAAAIWTRELLDMLEAFIDSRMSDAERSAIGNVITGRLAHPPA